VAAVIDCTGVMLAGGHSQRFGDADKALARIDGEPMLARVVDRVGAFAPAVVVSCREDQRARFAEVLGPDVRYVTDPSPDGGPLVGLHAALGDVSTAYVAVVACDMPAVDPDFLSVLFDYASGREGARGDDAGGNGDGQDGAGGSGDGPDGAVPRLREGYRQPTQAVYRTDALGRACADQLAAGSHSLREALDRLELRVLDPETVAEHTTWRSLTNVNTREDLASFRRDSTG